MLLSLGLSWGDQAFKERFKPKELLLGYPSFKGAEMRSPMPTREELRKSYRVKTWMMSEKITDAEIDSYVKEARRQGFNVLLTEGNRNLFIDRPENVPSHPMGSVMGPVFEDLIHNSKRARESANKNGMRFFIHITSIMVNKNVIDEHPDWAMIDIQTGEAFKNAYGTYTTCINNDAFFDEYMRRLERYFKESGSDGIMLDEIQFLGENTCGCKSCIEKFKKETGYEMPDKNNIRGVNVRDAATRRWIQWRAERTKVRLIEIDKMLRKVNPEMLRMDYLCNPSQAYAYYAAGINVENYVNHVDSIGYEVEPPGFNYLYNTNLMISEMKYLRAISEKIDHSMWSFFYPKINGDFIWNWFIAMSQGSRTWWYSHTSQYDNDTWQPLVNWEETYSKAISGNKAWADVGLVFPRKTRDYIRMPELQRAGILGFMAVSGAMIDSHTPYRVILEEDLSKENTYKDLKTLLLVNVAAMDSSQIEGIKRFAQGGGTVFISGQSSLYDREGERLKNFQLAPLIGASFKELKDPEERRSKIFEISKSAESFGFNSKSLTYHGSFSDLKEIQPNVKVLGYYTIGSERYPALLMREEGKGKIVYCAGHPEDGYFYSYWGVEEIHKGEVWKDHRDLQYLDFWKVIGRLSGDLPWSADNLPRGVVVEGFKHDFSGLKGYAIHLANFSGGLLKEGVVPSMPTISFPEVQKLNPKLPIKIKVRALDPKSAFVISPDFDQVVQLKVKKEGDYSFVELDRFDRYSIVYFCVQGEKEFEAFAKGKFVQDIPKSKELLYSKLTPLVGRYDPQAIYLFADQESGFQGGQLYRADEFTAARYIYGTDSDADKQMLTGRFTVKDVIELPLLEIGGMDDNRSTKSKIEIRLNGQIIQSGETRFEDSKMSKIKIPLQKENIKLGENIIEFKTLEPGKAGSPPWIGVEYIKVTDRRN